MSIEITDMVCYAGSKDRFLCRVQRESEESGGYHGRKQKRIFLKRNECGDCSGDCRGGFSAYGMTTGDAYGVIKNDAEIVKNYLLEKGVTEEEFVFSSVDISQRYRTEYDENGNYVRDYPDGYDLYQSLTVTSNDIDKVEMVSRDITKLIESGIEFASFSPEYYCTTLDEVKLDLIQKATDNARQRIDILVDGTGCRRGRLLTATLGVFQITATNSGSGEYSYDGAFDTKSRHKTAMITVRLNYAAE